MLISLSTKLCQAVRKNPRLSIMVHGPRSGWSVCHDLEPVSSAGRDGFAIASPDLRASLRKSCNSKKTIASVSSVSYERHSRMHVNKS